MVAWNGARHEVYERGAVVYEGDRVVHAGGAYAGAVDARVSARGKLVSPGFINTHVHTTGNGGDWMLGDMVKNDHRTSNYLAFAAPLKGKLTPPPPEIVAALRTYVFLHALKNGSTTIIDVGGLRGDWEGYARLVDDLGVRVYASPPFRDRNTFTDERGRLYYDADAAAGAKQLDEAVGLRQGLRRDGAGAPARHAERGAGGDVQRAPPPRGQGGGARPRRAHPHARGRQPDRVPARHGRAPEDADPVPRRHRVPRPPHAHRPRRLHHRASVDAVSLRRRHPRPRRDAAPPSGTARTSTPRWP